MLGCFRTGDANDPQTYVTAITAILAKYPEEVITIVTHPATGLPSKKGWLPTIKEVIEACEDAVEPIRQNELRLKRIKDQLEAREREDRGDKPTLEQLKERFGEDWGLSSGLPKKPSEFKAPSWQSIISTYSADPSRIQRLMKSDLMPQSEEAAE